MSIFSVAPFAVTAGIGAMIVGSVVTVPIATNGLLGGGNNWSVTELFSRLGCATLTKGKTSEDEGNVYLCYFSSSASKDFPKLKLFYNSGNNRPKRIVRIKKVDSSDNQGQISLTLENDVVITEKADSKLMSSWIKYLGGGRGGKELIPEQHCSIDWGKGQTGNLYNFTCSLDNWDAGKTWVSQVDPFRFVKTPES